MERIGIVSARQAAVPPSQTCASEFEDVLAAMLSAPIVSIFDNNKADNEQQFDRLIFVAMNYWQLSRMIERSGSLRQCAGPCHAYVFDAFHLYLDRWLDRFPRLLRTSARVLRHELRNMPAMAGIFIPVDLLIMQQQQFLQVPLHYLPIGVDAVSFGSQRQDRSIDVNGYGRQPPALSNHLADRLNVRDGRYLFHHTDHAQTTLLTDPPRHRRLFWRMLAESKIALAYAPEAYDPLRRFDCTFIGQRWYESLAAGCVVMGQAPATAEVARLFDWPDALIELSPDPETAWKTMERVINNPDRRAAISRRNHREAVLRHDWRHRIVTMAAVLGIEPDDRFKAELARTAQRAGADPDGSLAA